MEERQFKGIWIPKEIWLTKDLSIQEKVILVEIDSFEGEEGCFASNKYFSKFFNLTPSRVSQIINLLVEKQYLDVEYIKEGKEIKKRVLRIKRPPYPEVFNLLNRGIENIKGGYLENCEDINISINNTNKEIDNNKLLSTKKKTKKEFTPPTLEEIRTYCEERKNNVDAKKFFDYYEANDWKDNTGKKVKSWKQKMIANWETNASKKQETKKETEEEWFERMEREVKERENEYKRN